MVNFTPDLSEALTRSLHSLQADDYRRTADILKSTQDNLQAHIRELTSGELQNIIIKLDHQQDLTKKDIETLKLWLVGEAQSYLSMESSFKDWQKDYQKLITSFKKYEKKTLKLSQLTELSGMIEDANRLIYLITNYLDKQARVLNFEKNLSKGQPGHNKFLVETLRNKLKTSG